MKFTLVNTEGFPIRRFSWWSFRTNFHAPFLNSSKGQKRDWIYSFSPFLPIVLLIEMVSDSSSPKVVPIFLVYPQGVGKIAPVPSHLKTTWKSSFGTQLTGVIPQRHWNEGHPLAQLPSCELCPLSTFVKMQILNFDLLILDPLNFMDQIYTLVI